MASATSHTEVNEAQRSACRVMIETGAVSSWRATPTKILRMRAVVGLYAANGGRRLRTWAVGGVFHITPQRSSRRSR
jgi:hypothetical protein